MTETLERTAHLTSKGQVTIPRDVRQALGLREGDPVIFRSEGGVVTIASGRKPTLGELLADFDPKQHRREPDERPFDDAPKGRERL
jgi:AbrB family looped-hinge helix DNA binding protein